MGSGPSGRPVKRSLSLPDTPTPGIEHLVIDHRDVEIGIAIAMLLPSMANR